MIDAAIFVVFPLCLAFAAFSDLITMTIPNRASAILLGAFVVVAPLAGLGFGQIALHAAAAGAVFAVCFCLFALNIMGGGDTKLLTASAIWFGLTTSLATFLVYVSIFGGVLTLAVLFLRKQENTILAAGIPVPRLLLTAKKIPYGIAIALGGFAAYPSSPLMQAVFARLS
ncbi:MULTISPECIES: prepilin peptidase [unclassified Sinorhizobium]|uniref:A24 family peptidase n=1 Tax=unclassified Sinorhizobium TaxID=2613772 RepID=UPI0024C3A35A|nr:MULTISPECIES: prepilin peptidase [unclassified Sinorhizobium]MDK1377434.1 prepilin peptidase [Sinorhizobium sp. 6-70]MDK1477675.1 prepilin peptidase [Sinorhizobium sp. 6-117]